LSDQEKSAKTPVSGPSLAWATAMLFAESEAPLVVWDVGALTDPGVSAVEALARVQLTAHRLGLEVRLRGAARELRELLELIGLCDVLPPVASGLESSGETEQREHALGVKEEADPDNVTG
jgi:STAS domain